MGNSFFGKQARVAHLVIEGEAWTRWKRDICGSWFRVVELMIPGVQVVYGADEQADTQNRSMYIVEH